MSQRSHQTPNSIGIAGCGRMGLPMLEALIQAGFPAIGFDIAPKTSPHVTGDITSFKHSIETLITVVRDQSQTEALLFGPQSCLDAPNLSCLIVASTLSPRYVKGLRARIANSIALIDAPMSGASIAAREARLSFMLGGAEADIAAQQPLFDAMGAHFHHMGAFGSGMQAKVLNNLLAASNTAMTRLVLDWGDAAGLEERALLDLIHTSSGQNWLASGFDEIEFARDGLRDDNSIGILVKDVESALDSAPEGADTALPRQVQSAIAALKPRPRRG
ncbi:MAG: NAD(P)-dependent oxidoreductase [Paracoccaceae bacterium]